MIKQILALTSLGVALCLTSACSTGAKTIMSDNFDPANAQMRNLWQNNGKGTWKVQGPISALPGCEDGCLRQNSEDPRALNAINYVTAPQISDGVIETKLRYSYELSIAESAEQRKEKQQFIGTGIVFRMVDVDNYYMFRLAGEDGVVLGKMVNGVWTDLGNPRRVDFVDGGRLRPNTWYKLKVAVHGNNIQCSINDNPVVNTFDPSYTVGRFGVVTFKTVADFEYFNVVE
jgi:hypothetical protein